VNARRVAGLENTEQELLTSAERENLPEPVESEVRTRSASRWCREPSLAEVLLVVAVTALVFFAVLVQFRPFLAVAKSSGDNTALVDIASAIRHWKFQGLNIKAFWGLSYVVAVVSLVTPLSDMNALLLVSYASGIATIILVHKLWGGWVAAFFAVLNFYWMQRLFLGGTESLFTALVFGSFLAARRKHWWPAALLAALSTIVRPVGIFVLVGLGFNLLWKRDFRNLALATVTGMIVGGLYVLPLALYFQNPLANVQTYQHQDWQGGQLLSWPFRAILRSMLTEGAPATSLVLAGGWTLFVLAGFLVLVLSQRCREYWRIHQLEMIFATSYILFLCTYNSPWARGNFPRFAIPALPFVFLALREWLPKDRRLVWVLAVVSPVLAACSEIGIKNVAEILRRTIV